MKKISIILVVAGVLVALIPVVGQIYTQYREDRMMSEWLNSADVPDGGNASETDPGEAYSQLQDAFDSESASTNTATEASSGEAATSGAEQAGTQAKAVKKAPQQTVLGIIQIKKIDVKAPIVEGVKSYNLSRAIGHIPGTAELGQPGNCVLAGHRSYTFGKFFNRLDELVIGDEITITTKKEDLTYKVSKVSIVKPDDVSVLDGSKDENNITLVTCTPIYIASHRLIVNAGLERRVLKAP